MNKNQGNRCNFCINIQKNLIFFKNAIYKQALLQYNNGSLILIEAAVQMSIPQRWQSVKWAKGNHRRTEKLGRAIRGVIWEHQ